MSSQVWPLWKEVHDSNITLLLLDNLINISSACFIGCWLWYPTSLCFLISQHNFDWSQVLMKVFCHTTHAHHLTNTVLMCYVCSSRSCILLCSYTISSAQFWYGVVALQGTLLSWAPSSFHQHTVSCLKSPTIILVTETGLCDVGIRHVKSKNEKYRCLYHHPSTYLSFINEHQSVKRLW
jgi:hypothetical protein